MLNRTRFVRTMHRGGRPRRWASRAHQHFYGARVYLHGLPCSSFGDVPRGLQKNAKTPLAVVYDDKSVLEQMHYSLILQIMRHNGLESLLDRPVSGPSFRKLLLGTVLATDLSLHYEFMANFQELVTGKDMGEVKRKLLVCQAIIKCADISNPVS